MRTNCVNCGAAIDTDVCKCPFCGTSYFDLTAIDFTSNEPVVLKLKAPSTRGTVLVSMLALPKLGEINQTVENVSCYGKAGTPLCSFTRSNNIDVGISFRAIQRANDNYNTLLTMEVSK